MERPYVPEATDNSYIENGRGYGTFHRGQYLLPNDSKEQERLDIMHTVILAARPKPQRLHHAPFSEPAQTQPSPWFHAPRVLDLGYGTGMWLLDMADKYPRTELIGFDINGMSPVGLYDNIVLHERLDYESPWALGESSFDLIHMQMGLGSVSNWPRLYDKIYKHLKPGGWFEHIEIDWTPRSDDGSLPMGKLQEWWHRYVKDPYDVVGRSLQYNPDTGLLLAQRGLTNVQHVQYRIPMHGWSGDRAEHISGTWWEAAMSFGEGRGHGFEAMSLAPLTRIQQWLPEHARRLCEDAIAEASNPNVRAYTVLHIWWAQKPTNAPI